MKQIIFTVVAVYTSSKQPKKSKLEWAYEPKQEEVELNKQNIRFLINLHEKITDYYQKPMSRLILKFKNKRINFPKCSTREQRIELLLIVDRCLALKDKYKMIKERIDKYKLNKNIQNKPEFYNTFVKKIYRNITNNRRIKINWINQEYNADVGLKILLLMSIERIILCRSYNAVVEMLINKFHAKFSKNNPKYHQKLEQIHKHLFLSKIIESKCTFYSKIYPKATAIQKHKIADNALFIKELQLRALLKIFCDEFLWPSFGSTNSIDISIYINNLPTGSFEYIHGDALLDLCLPEKPFLFMIFPGFISLQNELKKVNIKSRKSIQHIISLFSKLDIMLKITKYAYTKSFKGNYAHVQKFCIKYNIYVQILNMFELVISTIVNSHDYSSELTIKTNDIAKKNKKAKTNDLGQIFHSCLINLRTKNLFYLEFMQTKDFSCYLCDKNEVLLFKISNKNFIISFEFIISPGIPEIGFFSDGLLSPYRSTSHNHEVFFKSCDLNREENPRIKSINQMFTIFKDSIKLFPQLKDSEGMGYPQIIYLLNIIIFRNNEESGVILESKVLSMMASQIHLILTANITHPVCFPKIKKSMVNSVISWFLHCYDAFSIEIEPFEIYADILEYFEFLIYRSNTNSFASNAYDFIKMLSDFHHKINLMFYQSFQGNEIYFIDTS